MVLLILLLFVVMLLPLAAAAARGGGSGSVPVQLKTPLTRNFQAAAAAVAAATTMAAVTTTPRAAHAVTSSFNEQWPYREPSDILAYVYANSKTGGGGDFEGVVSAMVAFASHYPMYALSRPKAEILVGALRAARPTSCLELGTFFGFSAMHTARELSQQGGAATLLCVEANPQNAEVARALLERALGKGSAALARVKIINGISTQVLQQQQQQVTKSTIAPPFDFVFLDHDKDCYLKDLKLLVDGNLLLLNQGTTTTIVADNVKFPGAPGFLDYVEAQQGWKTRLIPCDFERIGFETKWVAVPDAMSITTTTTTFTPQKIQFATTTTSAANKHVQ